MNIVVWNEYVHERRPGLPAELYPHGIHGAIAAGLRSSLGATATVSTATLDEPDHGLPATVLDDVDVLVWWGHLAHEEVSERKILRDDQFAQARPKLARDFPVGI